ncbi:cytochrome c oxidase assembly factor CtaG [Paenibacillus sp. Leaf72]|uniref:cytochrome c oxidase assembly factor CtaG n=1 Tax=Paenibacillus sp. Leaf72 TaxID=1736234 RepID=UPI0006FF95A2|nr:cytochrome c oxidase assembly factor CtaG [Paenibacillus sp. Leaf72]KQN97180.1 cytochrome c oxidase assembly factor CtaG [Paenibacillus sp. Leaf72]
MLGLEYFSFEELWTPWYMFGTIAVLILYFYLNGPWREKHSPQEVSATGKQRFMFVVSAILYYLCNGGPLNFLGHLMFTFHMFNMSISYLIVPPMLILSIPAFMWRKLFASKKWRSLNFLMNPILSLLLFNLLFSFYHVPVIHDFVMTHYTIHRIYYFVMLIAAIMMWWQIACPVPEWNRLTDLKKMAYVFANGILLTPACALIIFASSPLYAVYNDPNVWVQAMGYCVSGDPTRLLTMFDGPQFFNLMEVVEDQQLGGIVMKLLQELMYGIILAYIFSQWYKREHKEDDLPNSNTGTA